MVTDHKYSVNQSVVLSWSGGKDSALALDALSRDPALEVVGLLTSVTSDYDRISIHGVRRSLLEAQVQRLGLPLFEIALAPGCSNDDYEAAFHLALAKIRQAMPEAGQIAFGDLFLEDVRLYREKLLEGTGFEPVFPLWGMDTKSLAKRFIDDGFGAHLVCVDTTQLDSAFAGRAFDHEFLADLPSTVDPCRRARRISHLRVGRAAVQRIRTISAWVASPSRQPVHVLRHRVTCPE